MLLRRVFLVVLGLTAVFSTLYAVQRPFRQFPGVEYEDFELTPDWQRPGEWTFARLMFPARRKRWIPWPLRRGLAPRPIALDTGLSPAPTVTSPKLFAVLLESRHAPSNSLSILTREMLMTGPGSTPSKLVSGGLTDTQASELREYLLRGGFFMADDFHGSLEWEVFQNSMKRVFPDRPIVEIEDTDAIFHTVYDLNDRYQIPGAAHLRLGYKGNGIGAHWRGIYDDNGRVMIAISYNSDLGDAWEWADDASYPERFSDLAIRVGVNDVVYAMTH